MIILEAAHLSRSRHSTPVNYVKCRGLHTAKFLTTVHDRLLPTGLAELANPHPTGQLKAAATAYRKAVDTLTVTTQFAA